MDPETIATISGAATALATEVGKGIASEAGKSAWNRIKSLFNWPTEPDEGQRSAAIERALKTDEALTKRVLEILQAESIGDVSKLVGTINAEKVVVADKIDTVNM